jgi:hypothetical protein
MKIVSSILLLSMGTAFGTGMVLSCSNDAPRQSDASTCDCEAPIAGRVVSIVGELVVVAGGEQSAAGITCDPGMQFLSGSCTGGRFFPQFDDVTLQASGFNPSSGGWTCVFKNNTAVPVQIRASVLCLKPAT